MTEEYLTIIDENDNVIGYKPRSECHNIKDLPLHQEIHVLIFNSEGKILLQRRSMKKETFPGLWTNSATGHVSKGETREEAAIKEMEEELKITNVQLEYVTKVRSTEAEVNDALIGIYKAIHNGPFEFDRDEIDEVKFFSIDELSNSKEKLTPGCKIVLKAVELIK